MGEGTWAGREGAECGEERQQTRLGSAGCAPGWPRLACEVTFAQVRTQAQRAVPAVGEAARVPALGSSVELAVGTGTPGWGAGGEGTAQRSLCLEPRFRARACNCEVPSRGPQTCRDLGGHALHHVKEQKRGLRGSLPLQAPLGPLPPRSNPALPALPGAPSCQLPAPPVRRRRRSWPASTWCRLTDPVPTLPPAPTDRQAAERTGRRSGKHKGHVRDANGDGSRAGGLVRSGAAAGEGLRAGGWAGWGSGPVL